MRRGGPSELWFPVDQWLARNLAMLSKIEEPRRRMDYLDGVEIARGAEVRRELADAFDRKKR